MSKKIIKNNIKKIQEMQNTIKTRNNKLSKAIFECNEHLLQANIKLLNIKGV